MPDDATAARDAHFTTRLPTKRIAADCLLFTEDGRIVLVKPTYKEPWDLPGGAVERDESPRDAARREVREELGLTVDPGSLLVVDWLRRQGEFTEVLALLFDGGVLTPETLASCAPDHREISEVRSIDPALAAEFLEPETFSRVAAALAVRESGQTVYLEDGSPVAEVDR
ncbi:MAG TPA: NUDIX hydrolase [Candidatus Avipropionibacterium avicola]|uniref:NUDIX hydrolase n=1 Tax=Candidatus Avipropionibacterium avicola TaxID=2840701 RepID=A0A9D1KML3_9ACTN|nr:NUDIX hydrolase [Candidatus Avipropionibacterium avicola]